MDFSLISNIAAAVETVDGYSQEYECHTTDRGEIVVVWRSCGWVHSKKITLTHGTRFSLTDNYATTSIVEDSDGTSVLCSSNNHELSLIAVNPNSPAQEADIGCRDGLYIELGEQQLKDASLQDGISIGPNGEVYIRIDKALAILRNHLCEPELTEGETA